MTVRENGHWGGFTARITVFTHYFVPGMQTYGFQSRGSSLTPLDAMDVGGNQCSLSLSSATHVYDHSSNVNDLYERTITLSGGAYAYCSARIEFVYLSTTVITDPDADFPNDSSRFVKFGQHTKVW